MIKWIGTNTDIEDRRHTQQDLQDQIKQHTADLEANARLETEMRQRALAQQELNQQNERMLKELTRRVAAGDRAGQDGRNCCRAVPT